MLAAMHAILSPSYNFCSFSWMNEKFQYSTMIKVFYESFTYKSGKIGRKNIKSSHFFIEL